MFAAQIAGATTYYWDANGTTAGFGTASGTWGTSAFWSSDSTGVAAPGSATVTTSDAVNYGTALAGLATGSVTVGGATNGFQSMTFGSASGTITLTGGTLNLAAGGSTIEVDNSADTVSSVLQGSAALTMQGAGKLILSGANTYSGGTTISAGTLQVNTIPGGVGTGTATINGGGLTLMYPNSSSPSFTNPITGAGSILITATALSGTTRTPNFNPGSMAGFSGTITVDTSLTKIYPQLGVPSGTTFDGSGAHWIVNGANPANSFFFAPVTISLIRLGDLSGNGTIASANASPGNTVEVGALNTSTTFSGILENTTFGNYPLSLTKIGSGTLTLSGNNTHSGTTTISGGTLQVGNGGATGSLGTSTVVNNANLVVNLTGSISVNAISGSGPLTTLGSGTLTLAGANSYNGATTVGNGTLAVAAANYSSASALTLSNNTTLNLNVTGGASSLATPNLTAGTNTTLNLAYGALPSGNPSVTAINVSGSLNALATNIVVNIAGSGFTTGHFPLIQYSGSIGGNGFAAFTLGSLPLGITGSISNNTANSSIDLVISGSSQVVWQGYVNGSWDTNGTLNWTNLSSGTAQAFTNGVPTVLDDTASGTTSLTLSGALQPASVLFNNSALNYSLSGPGSLGGAMSLTENGTGSLLITTTNTYTGGTFINAGTVQFGNGVSANGSVTGNIVNNGALILANPGAQTNAGVISGTGPLTVSGKATLSGVNTYTGQTTVTNYGTLTLSGNRTNTPGIIQVCSGTLNIQNGNFSMVSGLYAGADQTGNDTNAVVNQTGGNITFSSGVALLVGNTVIVGPVMSGDTDTYNLSGGSIAALGQGVRLGVNSGDAGNLPTATFNLSGSGFLNLSNSIVQIGRADSTVNNWNANFNQTGGKAVIGTLTMGGGSTSGSQNINASLNLTGGTNIVSNFTHLSEGSANISTIKIGGTADVTLPAFPTLRGAGSTAAITFDGGILRPYAASTAYLQGLNNAYLTTNGANFNVASGNDITVAQAITNAVGQAGKLVKTGAGTLTLTGANTYSGNTTVSNGTLVLGAAYAATGNLTVVDGTKLVCWSAAPGTTVNLPSATLGSTTGANLLAQFTGNSGNPTTPAGYITNLTLNGSTPVSILCGGLQAGTIPLFQYTTLSGSGSVTNGALPQGVVGSITNNPTTKTISLVITGINPLVWSGVTSSIWDINVSTNWLLSATPTTYLDAASVCLFNDTAVTGNVIVTQAVSPGSMVFSNNSVAYNLGASGTGSIGGFGGLVKAGTGTLVITNANTYSGGTTISGGTLQINNAGGIGTGAATINGGALTVNYPVSSVTFSNPISGSGTVNLTAAGAGGSTITPFFSPTSMTGFTGTVTVDTGITRIYYALVPPTGATTFDGSAAHWVVNNQNALSFMYVPNNTVTLVRLGDLSGNGTIAGCNSGSGVTYEVGALNTSSIFSGLIENNTFATYVPTLLTKTGNGILTLAGTNTYTGATTVNSGGLLINGAIINSTVIVNAGAVFGGSGTVSNTVSYTDGSIATNNVGAPLTVGTLDMAGNAAMNVATAAPLSAGDYPLINYTSLTSGGQFTNLNIGGAGLASGATASVVFTNSTVALSVVGGGAPSPTNISYTISGSSLILNWPAGQGWQLQAQTNSLTTGLTTNWITVSGASPPLTNTLTPANPSVFFRLKY